jgi:hypothetical protein
MCFPCSPCWCLSTSWQCFSLSTVLWTEGLDTFVGHRQLLRAKEQRNILHEIRKRKANWIGHILCRNCLQQRVIKGKIQGGGIEVTGRQGRRRRKLLDNLKERRGYSHLNEEALDRTIWRARFGRGFGPVVRQITKWNEWMNYNCTFCYYLCTLQTKSKEKKAEYYQ